MKFSHLPRLPWFDSASRQMLRWFTGLPVATACFWCSPSGFKFIKVNPLCFKSPKNYLSKFGSSSLIKQKLRLYVQSVWIKWVYTLSSRPVPCTPSTPLLQPVAAAVTADGAKYTSFRYLATSAELFGKLISCRRTLFIKTPDCFFFLLPNS
jgi:hypothetical protein